MLRFRRRIVPLSLLYSTLVWPARWAADNCRRPSRKQFAARCVATVVNSARQPRTTIPPGQRRSRHLRSCGSSRGLRRDRQRRTRRTLRFSRGWPARLAVRRLRVLPGACGDLLGPWWSLMQCRICGFRRLFDIQHRDRLHPAVRRELSPWHARPVYPTGPAGRLCGPASVSCWTGFGGTADRAPASFELERLSPRGTS